MRNWLLWIVSCNAIFTLQGAAFYSGGTYAQDFSELQNANPNTPYKTFPDGWFLLASSPYYWSNGGAGLLTGKNYYSFSSTINVPDKALGLITHTLQGGNYPNTAPYFTFQIQNLTQTTFTGLFISFKGEQWKEGAVLDNPSTLRFYLNDVEYSSLAFVSPHSGDGVSRPLDGNLSENQENLSATIYGLLWSPGDTLTFKWSMPVAESLSAAHGLAIDDFSFVAIPEPSVICLLAASVILLFLSNSKKIFFVVVLTCGMTGCNRNSGTSIDKKDISDLGARVAAIEMIIDSISEERTQRSDSAESQFPKLSEQTERIREDVKRLSGMFGKLANNDAELRRMVEALQNIPSVPVGLEGDGYSIIPCKTGHLLFRVEKIEPYLSGYKIIAQIGNPSLVTYSGLEVLTTFPSPEGQERVHEAFSFTQPFEPGKWTTVTFNAHKLGVEQLSDMRVSIHPKSIKLLRN